MLGEEHILYASGLNNLSLVCLDRGDLERAAALLERAAAILERYPDCLDELATSLCNLGSLKQRMGRLEESKADLERVVELYETKLGTITPHYHAALNALGLTYLKEGLCDQARSWLEKGAKAAEKLYGPEHRETISTREHLALALRGLEEQG